MFEETVRTQISQDKRRLREMKRRLGKEEEKRRGKEEELTRVETHLDEVERLMPQLMTVFFLFFFFY